MGRRTLVEVDDDRRTHSRTVYGHHPTREGDIGLTLHCGSLWSEAHICVAVRAAPSLNPGRPIGEQLTEIA